MHEICYSGGALLAGSCLTVLLQLPLILLTGFIARPLLRGLLNECTERYLCIWHLYK